MRAGDDTAAGRLAEDFGELHARHGSTGDQIMQHHAGTDGRELVRITDDEQMRSLRQGGEQLGHQWRVDHRRLVDDEQIADERLATMTTPLAIALEFEQAVQRFGLQSGAFGQALRCAAGGGCEHEFDLLALQNEQNAAQDRRLSHTGSAGDDEQALPQGLAHGPLLAFGQFFAGLLHHPTQRGIFVDDRIRRRHGSERFHTRCDALLRCTQIRQI